MSDILVGQLEIIETDKESGEEKILTGANKVLDVGIAAMWQRVTQPDGPKNNQFNTLYFGSDFGDPIRWSIFNPEPANRAFDITKQVVTHQLNPNSVQFEYPTDDVLLVKAFIDGTPFMNDYYPSEVEYRFNSLTLRFNNDTPFAFKRFPIRSISRYVQIQINWRFTLINEEDWCGDE